MGFSESVSMSENAQGLPGPPVDYAADRFRRRRKAKAHKVLDGKLHYVVGNDIFMERVEALCAQALVGRLEYASMDKKYWVC